MEQKDYITQRLEDQIDWYGKKCRHNKLWSNSLKIMELTCAAIIPFIAGFGNSIPFAPVITGVLGVIIGISAGVATLNKYHDNWIAYRGTCETLKHEKYLFLTNTTPYDIADSFHLFVQNIENIISKENTQWTSVNRVTDTNKNNYQAAEV